VQRAAAHEHCDASSPHSARRRRRSQNRARRARPRGAAKPVPSAPWPCACGGCSTASSAWTSAGTMTQVDGPLRARDANGPVDEMADLFRRHRRLHELVRDVLEERGQNRLPAGRRRRWRAARFARRFATTGW
jgi:hypothetical protein